MSSRPVGRPSKYTEDMPERAWHYVENYQEYGDVVPMVAGLAVALGLHKDTVYSWCQDSDKRQFSDAVSFIEVAQHKALVNGGISGAYNPTITKLMLSSNHGYSEKQTVDQTVEHSGSVTVSQAEAKQISQALDDEC